MVNVDGEDPARRDENGERRCSAMAKSTGKQCTRRPIVGLAVCPMHGGATPSSRGKRQDFIDVTNLKEEVARLGGRRDIHPAEALLDLVYWTAGEVDYWRDRVRELQDDELVWGLTQHREGIGPEGPINVRTSEAKPNIVYAMLERASDRLASYAMAALKAGVDERRVRVAEQQGALVATVIRDILTDLGLSKAQEALVSEVVPRHLRALTAESAS